MFLSTKKKMKNNSTLNRNILKCGGSVADAAIAALFCEGVSNPQSMGLGGGFLLTIFKKSSGTVQVLNARENAPYKAHKDMFNECGSENGKLIFFVQRLL